jgi:N-glycosylase/DNA lyase
MLEQFTGSAELTCYESTILSNWAVLKAKIQPWLAQTSTKWQDKEAVHFELTFCLCTPQSRAPLAREAVKRLKESGVLHTGNQEQILSYLAGVRFNEKKSFYIVEARDRLYEIYSKIMELKEQPFQLREWLVASVNGYGYKEATHFLRNIGLGEQLAMFDVHIIRAMVEAGHLAKDSKEAEGGLAGKKYKELEQVFLAWAKKLGLKPAELDITLWLTYSGNKEIM